MEWFCNNVAIIFYESNINTICYLIYKMILPLRKLYKSDNEIELNSKINKAKKKRRRYCEFNLRVWHGSHVCFNSFRICLCLLFLQFSFSCLFVPWENVECGNLKWDENLLSMTYLFACSLWSCGCDGWPIDM